MNASFNLSLSRVLLGIAVGLILVFLLVPIVIVVPLSFSDTRFMTFPPPALSLSSAIAAAWSKPARERSVGRH